MLEDRAAQQLLEMCTAAQSAFCSLQLKDMMEVEMPEVVGTLVVEAGAMNLARLMRRLPAVRGEPMEVMDTVVRVRTTPVEEVK